MGYSTGGVAKLFNVSRETVRQWALEFGDYMSPGATPAKGAYRQFDDDDVRIMALISQSKQVGLSYEDIHAALKSGQRAEPTADLGAIQTSSVNASQVAALHNEITRLKEYIASNQQAFDKQAGQVELLERQLKDARDQINQLNREIGRLEGKLGDE